MAGYGNFCPLSMAAEVVADRWTPLILRELMFGNTRFNDIARAMPGISRSLLVQRLRHLERKGVLDSWPSPTGRGSEYHLTRAGKDLERVVDSLGQWAVEWLFDQMRPGDVSATTLMWWMHRRMDVDRLPPGCVVVEFQHTAPEPVTLWLVLDHGAVSVRTHHPGREPDVVVTADTGALAGVFQGCTTWQEALTAGTIGVAGPPGLTEALPTWFLWSPWAGAARERAQRARRPEEEPVEPLGPTADSATAAAPVCN